LIDERGRLWRGGRGGVVTRKRRHRLAGARGGACWRAGE
jgi:hypothetical protein